MELRQLRYFVTVAEELHFGRAAELLHIGQPAVSQQIRRLERELGVELFNRSTRTVALTEAGRLFLPHARDVLAAAARARTAIDELRAVVLRLGTSSGLGARLETILAEFARRAPHAQLELVSTPTEDRLNRVRSGDLDATLLRGDRAEPELEFLPLWQDELMVALPAQHDIAAREAVDFADLEHLPLRLTRRAANPALHDLVLRCCREAGFAPRFGPEFTTAQDTLAAIGFSKPSWTVFYAPHAAQLPVPGVVFRALRNPTPLARTYLAVRPDPPRAELRVLIEACHQG
ncbi:MAG TPA: LysR family transcriptional regulator [Pseudonocardiaceae bacterium]|jgi:DNA-binding transcriptional LysR family regulator